MSMEKSASASDKTIAFEDFYSYLKSLNCSNLLKFWIASESCLKRVDEKDLKVEYFSKFMMIF